MRILVTGASGYIGLHLLRELLEHGHSVTAVVRSPLRVGPFASRVTVIQADLEDGTVDLEGQDALVHAALLWGEPGKEVRDVAVSARLFEAAGRAGVSRCVYLSSVAVHRPFVGEMTEEDRLWTTDVYGATKAAGELYLRAAGAEYGMTGIVLRPGPVVGPPAFPGGAFRSDRRLTDIVAAVREGRPVEVTEGEGRQWSDVSVVATVIRRLLSVVVPPPTLICVDRQLCTWDQIARWAGEYLGQTPSLTILPSTVAVPRFRTARVEGLLGSPASAQEALRAHLRQLCG